MLLSTAGTAVAPNQCHPAAFESSFSDESFLHDRGQMALHFSDGDVTTRHLWGLAVDQLLAAEEIGPSSTETLWALTDHLGTVRDLALYDDVMNATSIGNHSEYDSFGNITDETNYTITTLFGFTGRYVDKQVQLQNNLNRWYDAVTGQWMSEDPIGFAAGDVNLRRYVSNQPEGFTDPSGLVIETDSPIDVYLEQFLSTFTKKVVGFKFHYTSGGDSVAGLSADSELKATILRKMMESTQRTFSIAGATPWNERASLAKHLDARMEIVRLAVLNNMDFDPSGKGKPFHTDPSKPSIVNRPFDYWLSVNNMDTKFACNDARITIMMAALGNKAIKVPDSYQFLDYVHTAMGGAPADPVHIPGDAMYFPNKNYEKLKPKDLPPGYHKDIFAGENVICMLPGDLSDVEGTPGLYWGHVSGSPQTIKPLGWWVERIGNWPGDPEMGTPTHIIYPKAGLD